MLLKFSVGLVDTGISKALGELKGKITHLNPVLIKIGNAYWENTQQRFKFKQDPNGKQWKRSTETTRRIKKEGSIKGRGVGIEGPYSMGVWSGYLKGSIGFNVKGNNILIGVLTNSKASVYAGIFQGGAKKGSFGGYRQGAGKKFRPTPWGDIPARPFLGFNKKTNDVVLKILHDYLAVNGG